MDAKNNITRALRRGTQTATHQATEGNVVVVSSENLSRACPRRTFPFSRNRTTVGTIAASTRRSTALALPVHANIATTTTTTTTSNAAAAGAADAAEAIRFASGPCRRLGCGGFAAAVTVTNADTDTDTQRLLALVSAEGRGQAAPEAWGGEGQSHPSAEDPGLPAYTREHSVIHVELFRTRGGGGEGHLSSSLKVLLGWLFSRRVFRKEARNNTDTAAVVVHLGE